MNRIDWAQVAAGATGAEIIHGTLFAPVGSPEYAASLGAAIAVAAACGWIGFWWLRIVTIARARAFGIAHGWITPNRHERRMAAVAAREQAAPDPEPEPEQQDVAEAAPVGVIDASNEQLIADDLAALADDFNRRVPAHSQRPGLAASAELLNTDGQWWRLDDHADLYEHSPQDVTR